MLLPDIFLFGRLETSSGNAGTKERITAEFSVFRYLNGLLGEPKPDSPLVLLDPTVCNNARPSKSLSYNILVALARECLR